VIFSFSLRPKTPGKFLTPQGNSTNSSINPNY
jgi:hypothetical protein